MIIFKNMFSFALTFKAYEWLVTNGTRATPVFNALGAVQVVVCLTSIPMCTSPIKSYHILPSISIMSMGKS